MGKGAGLVGRWRRCGRGTRSKGYRRRRRRRKRPLVSQTGLESQDWQPISPRFFLSLIFRRQWRPLCQQTPLYQLCSRGPKKRCVEVGARERDTHTEGASAIDLFAASRRPGVHQPRPPPLPHPNSTTASKTSRASASTLASSPGGPRAALSSLPSPLNRERPSSSSPGTSCCTPTIRRSTRTTLGRSPSSPLLLRAPPLLLLRRPLLLLVLPREEEASEKSRGSARARRATAENETRTTMAPLFRRGERPETAPASTTPKTKAPQAQTPTAPSTTGTGCASC